MFSTTVGLAHFVEVGVFGVIRMGVGLYEFDVGVSCWLDMVLPFCLFM